MTNEEYIEQNPHQFKDEIDKWLFREFSLSGGACSSIRSLEYSTARKVAEKLLDSLWKPADGDNLPEYEREVVVFTQNFPDDAGMMRVAIGHRPNPDGWNGKSITTGNVEHYTPKIYDKGGWNIPDVKWWLDVELPKEIEL